MNIPISIKLDKERSFKFTFLTVARFDENFNRKFFQVSNTLMNIAFVALQGDPEKAGTQVSLDDLLNLCWCALLHEEKTLTVEKTGEILEIFFENGGELGELIAKIAEALGNFLARGIIVMPKEEKASENEKPPMNQPNQKSDQENPSPTSEIGSENPNPTLTESSD